MSKIGFVGLGIMGTPMAGHLLAAGHELFVHDLRPPAQALLAARWRFARDWELGLSAGFSDLERDRYFSQFENYSLVNGNGTSETRVFDDVTLGPGQWAQLDDVFVVGSSGTILHRSSVGGPWTPMVWRWRPSKG